MADSRFPDDERGIGPDARQTSLQPTMVASADAPSGSATKAPTTGSTASGGKTISKGVIFLLSEEGHARYFADSAAPGNPDAAAHAAASAVFDNSVLFARNLNQGLRREFNVNYDPLELCYFTILADVLSARPGANVAGGRWASAAILTHSAFNATGGRTIRTEPGLWFAPAPVFASALREYSTSDDPEFSDIRDRFDPAGTLHMFVCGGLGDFRDLACATRALFGLNGHAFVPRSFIQVRDGGILYASMGNDEYRRFDPGRDMRTVTTADCGRR